MAAFQNPEQRRAAGPDAPWLSIRAPGWLLLGTTLLIGCDGANEPAEASRPERADVAFAIAAQPISAPVYVADSLGFFEAEGLEVELVLRPTGETALHELRAGRAHFATTAETPVVHAVLVGDNVMVLSTMATTRRGLVVMARADRGIDTPSALRETRIGVTFDINAEFFLNLFLTLHGLVEDEVALVNVPPDSIVRALVDGRVDAVVAWEPLRTEIRERLGTRVKVFTAPEVYTWFWNVVSRDSIVDAYPNAAAALLRAIKRAVGYMDANPDRSREIVMARLGQGAREVEVAWSGTRFIVSLDQALVMSMEDQALWLLDHTVPANLPNIVEYIDPGPLEAVDSDAVSVPGGEDMP